MYRKTVAQQEMIEEEGSKSILLLKDVEVCQIATGPEKGTSLILGEFGEHSIQLLRLLCRGSGGFGHEKGTSLILTGGVGGASMQPCHEPRDRPKEG
jgi:hypothetical protein